MRASIHPAIYYISFIQHIQTKVQQIFRFLFSFGVNSSTSASSLCCVLVVAFQLRTSFTCETIGAARTERTKVRGGKKTSE